MTDDDRAERAFRDALRRAADDYGVVPLEPVSSRPRRWRPAVLAAAAVLVLVGTLALTLPGDGGKVPVSLGTPNGSSEPPPSGDLPADWHWESSRDAIVGVPDSWGYGFAADSQWCVGDEPGLPSGPFVDLHGPLVASTLVACQEVNPSGDFDGIPERFLRTHLTFPWYQDVPAGTRTWRGWTQITRHVGSAVIQVLADEEHLAVAQQVVDSARQADVDGNGCSARSPIQQGGFARPKPSFDVESLASIDRVVICQYAVAYPEHPETADTPGLIASRSLEGNQASRLLTAIQAAPAGGGPNQPDTCLHEMSGDSAITIRLSSGGQTHELYAYYDWCIGNGLDDGTTLRSLTADTCAPLFGDRLFWGGGSGQLLDLCYRPRD